MNLKRYRLRDPAATVPMPDRGGRLFSQDAEGEMVDVENRFYATMIADGDLVPADAGAIPLTKVDQPLAPEGAPGADLSSPRKRGEEEVSALADKPVSRRKGKR